MRTLALLLLTSTLVIAAESVTSAANPKVGITADSLATVRGDNIATQTAFANSLPWPIALGDMPGVNVVDSTGNTMTAGLVYVSPSQMNIWIPAGVAPGPGTIEFPFTGLHPGVGAAAKRIVPVTIQKVAPGLFSADGSGSGPAAAWGVRVTIPTQIQSPVAVVTCDPKSGCTAVPVDPGLDAPVYLSFYGTGIRGASAPANVMVKMGGVQVQPIYAGPQGQVPGLDQVNVPLPLSLRGSGLVDVTVTVDGVSSNAVQIRVQ